MDSLTALKNACVQKITYKSFKDIQHGEYVIRRFSLAKTIHGKKVRIELDNDTYMYLPERFADALTESVIQELNSKPKIMVYKGKDAAQKDRLILDFKDSE